MITWNCLHIVHKACDIDVHNNKAVRNNPEDVMSITADKAFC